MTLDEGHRMTTVAATHDTVSTTATVVPTGNRIEHVPFQVEIQTQQVVFRVHDTRPDIVRTFIALHEGDLRFRMFVVVIVMPVIESVTLVVTETVVFHHVTHPFQVGDEHLLHLRHVMRPIARTVPVLSVIVVTRSSAPTSTRPRVLFRRFVPIGIHLVVLAYIRCIRIELSVLAKVHLGEVAPSRPTGAVVDYDIGYHLAFIGMQRRNQRFQFLTGTPVGVLIAILLRVITRSVSIGTGR